MTLGVAICKSDTLSATRKLEALTIKYRHGHLPFQNLQSLAEQSREGGSDEWVARILTPRADSGIGEWQPRAGIPGTGRHAGNN